MAPSKEKLLESAQKSLKKKQIQKAISNYAKVVDLDPADIRSRQKLAELYVRTNNNAEAYEHFEAVAKYFAGNGYNLKAIAIYKQMLRLDPSQVALYNRLAELNEKQGLIGNAMAEYRSLISHYERNGMVADAIKTLEKMRDLDASNLNVRVKLAEVYAANEREEEGLFEFESVLEVLSERSDYGKILKLYKMFLPLFPDNEKLQMGLALSLYETGELDKGVEILNNLLKSSPESADLLRLLARGYADLNDWPQASATYQKLLELDVSDLDNRAALVRCYISNSQFEQALDELEEWKDSFFKADRLEELQNFYEQLKDLLPGNSRVAQTLDSIYDITGEGDKLLDIMAARPDEPEEEPVEETLSDSVLDSANDDLEMPLIDIDMESAEEELEPVEEEEALGLPPEESDFDLQLEPFEEIAEVEEEPEEQLIELSVDADSDLEPLDDEDLEFSFDIDNEELAAPVAEPPKDLQGDLEEVEFYIEQGLYDEAEKRCQDILVYAPDSTECKQKLDLIQEKTAQPEALDLSDLEEVADEALSNMLPDLDSFLDADAVDEVVAEKKVFRTDVDEQIAADDMESHYNLGIAYREMGLLDDAISEFDKANKDPLRYVDCCTLKGLCYSDKGDFVNAERMFQQALDADNLEDSQRMSLGYELGALYERSERYSDAVASYQLVFDQDQGFRDVASKLTVLKEQMGLSGDGTTGGMDDENKERASFF